MASMMVEKGAQRARKYRTASSAKGMAKAKVLAKRAQKRANRQKIRQGQTPDDGFAVTSRDIV